MPPPSPFLGSRRVRPSGAASSMTLPSSRGMDSSPIGGGLLAASALGAAPRSGLATLSASNTDSTAKAGKKLGVRAQLREGTFKLFADLIEAGSMYGPLSVAMICWECLQLLSFVLSPSTNFPWFGQPAMYPMPLILQIITLGMYIPEQSSLAAAEFAICLSLIWLMLLTLAWLVAQGVRPESERSALAPPVLESSSWAVKQLRWLMLMLCHGGWTSCMTQMLSVFHCSPGVSRLAGRGAGAAGAFLGSMQCWSGFHVALVVIASIALPLFLCTSVLCILFMFRHEPQSHDPLARPHGRILLVMMLFKAACVVAFTVDDLVSPWVLVVVVGASALGSLFLVAVYVPFQWQFLNQVAAGGYAAVAWAVIPLAIGMSRADGALAAWVLWFGMPLAAICGYMTTMLQWYHWIPMDSFELTNVYKVELKCRRLMELAGHSDTATFTTVNEQVELLWNQATKYFSGSSTLHVFIAQYFEIYRANLHMERGQLRLLERSSGTNLDEQFYVFYRRRCINEAARALDRLNVHERFQVHHHRSEANKLALRARHLQVTFWTELVDKSPSAATLALTADELWRTIQECEKHFEVLLAMCASSVAVLRDYAQFLQEVANHSGRAAALMQDADDLEAAQARAQREHIDVVLSSTAHVMDLSGENLGVVLISHDVHDLGVVLDANPVCLQMFGYTRRELLGKSVNVLIPEPLASLHDGFLRAYLVTGQSTMLQTVRTAFGLHRNGYIFPLVQTTRALDTGFNAVQQVLHTNDNFCWVTEHDMRVTGVCQRTMNLLQLTPRQLQSGKLVADALFPQFAQVYAAHKSDAVSYQDAALRAVDGRGTADRVTTVPADLRYDTTVTIPGMGAGVASTATLRFQRVQLPGTMLVVVKWQLEGQGATQRPSAGQASELLGNVLSVADQLGSQVMHARINKSADDSSSKSDPSPTSDAGVPGVLSQPSPQQPVQHAELRPLPPPLKLGPVSEVRRPTTPTPLGLRASEREVQFDGPPLTTGGPLSRRKLLAERSMTRDTDGHSQRSGDTSKSTGELRRRLEASNAYNPSVLRLRRSLVVIFGCIFALIAANFIAQSIIVPIYVNTLHATEHSSNREVSLQRSLLYAQDLWLHATGMTELSDAAEADSRANLLAWLDEFEQWHKDLYQAVAPTDAVLQHLYSSESFPTHVLNAHGQRVNKMSTFFGAGLEYVSAGRLAAAADVHLFTEKAAPAYFVLANGQAELARATNTSTLIMKDMSDSVFAFWSLAEVLGMIAIGGLGVVIILLFILPALVHMDRSKHATLQTFLAVPLPVLRALKRQSEAWLEAARRQNEDSDDEGGRGVLADDSDAFHEGGGLDSLTDALVGLQHVGGTPTAVQVAARENRRFDMNLQARWGLLARVLLPLCITLGGFVGLLAWVQQDANNLQRAGTEFLISHTLQQFPFQAHFHLRLAEATTNGTQALNEVALARTALWSTQKFEHDMLFGSPDRQTHTVLDNPLMVHLFMEDGCDSPEAVYQAPNCSTFYDGLFLSGAHAALAEFVRLCQIRADLVTDAWSSAPTTSNRTRSAEWLASHATTAADEMLHLYLALVMHQLGDNMFDVTQVFGSAFDVKILAASVCFVVGLFGLHVVYYRPLIDNLDTELRRSRAMILLFPDQVVRAVPAVGVMVKQMAATLAT